MSRPSGSAQAMPAEVKAILRKLGVDIKRARLARGFSIREMALRAGVTPGTYMKLERGQPVSTSLLLTAAWVLGLSRAFFDVIAAESAADKVPGRAAAARLLDEIERHVLARDAS